jgi:hypothetical protein
MLIYVHVAICVIGRLVSMRGKLPAKKELSMTDSRLNFSKNKMNLSNLFFSQTMIIIVNANQIIIDTVHNFS